MVRSGTSWVSENVGLRWKWWVSWEPCRGNNFWEAMWSGRENAASCLFCRADSQVAVPWNLLFVQLTTIVLNGGVGSCLLPQHTSDCPIFKRKKQFTFYFSFSSNIMFPSVCIQPACIICSKGPIYLPRGDTIRSSCLGSVTRLPEHCDSKQGVGFHNSHVRAAPQMHQATKPESMMQGWGLGHFSDVKISSRGSIYPVPPSIRFPKCTASFFSIIKSK